MRETMANLMQHIIYNSKHVISPSEGIVHKWIIDGQSTSVEWFFKDDSKEWSKVNRRWTLLSGSRIHNFISGLLLGIHQKHNINNSAQESFQTVSHRSRGTWMNKSGKTTEMINECQQFDTNAWQNSTKHCVFSQMHSAFVQVAMKMNWK